MLRGKFRDNIFMIFLLIVTVSSNPCKNYKLKWISNSRGCNWAYQCLDGDVRKEYDCGENVWFDPVNIKCTRDYSQITCRFDDSTLIECPAVGRQLYPHEYSCRKYIVCQDGLKSEEICDLYQSFSPITNKCMPSEEAECIAEYPDICPKLLDDNQSIVVPSNLDNGVYYVCVQNNVVKLQCAPGLKFDKKNLWCDVEQKSPKVKPGVRAPSQPSVVSIQCPNDPLLYVPHPESCDYYFICMRGKSFLRSCNKGLIFDIHTRECNHRDNGAECYHDWKSTTTTTTTMATPLEVTEATEATVRIEETTYSSVDSETTTVANNIETSSEEVLSSSEASREIPAETTTTDSDQPPTFPDGQDFLDLQ